MHPHLDTLPSYSLTTEQKIEFVLDEEVQTEDHFVPLFFIGVHMKPCPIDFPFICKLEDPQVIYRD